MRRARADMNMMQRVLLGYAICFLLTVAVIGVVIYIADGASSATDSVTEANRLVRLAAEIRTSVLSEDGIALLGSAESPRGAAIREAQTVTHDPDLLARIEDLRETDRLYTDAATRALGASSGSSDTPTIVNLADAARNRLYSSATVFLNATTANAETAAEAWESAHNGMLLVLAAVTLPSVILVLAAGMWLAISLEKPISTAVGRVLATQREILPAAETCAAGAVRNLHMLDDLRATVALVQRAAESGSTTAQGLAARMDANLSLTKDGLSAADEASTAMVHVRGQLEATTGHVDQLAEETALVESIIATVSDLAEQSELLAINAAIQAEKSGDAGTGLSVVADEVRGLADRSQAAVAGVRLTLDEMRSAIDSASTALRDGADSVERGNEAALGVSAQIKTLAESIASALDSVTVMTASVAEQYIGIEQVADATDVLVGTSKRTAASAKRIEAEALELRQLARELEGQSTGRIERDDGTYRRIGPSTRVAIMRGYGAVAIALLVMAGSGYYAIQASDSLLVPRTASSSVTEAAIATLRDTAILARDAATAEDIAVLREIASGTALSDSRTDIAEIEDAQELVITVNTLEGALDTVQADGAGLRKVWGVAGTTLAAADDTVQAVRVDVDEVRASTKRAINLGWVIAIAASFVFLMGDLVRSHLMAGTGERKLNEITRDVGVTGRKIAVHVDEAAAVTDSTLESIAETGTAVAEVRQTAAAMRDRTAELDTSACNARDTTAASIRQVADGRKLISSVLESVTRVSSAVEELGMRAEAIGGVISDIDEFAEQSNLLSVNAAIEAATAGESEPAFTEVATEIKRLALSSKHALANVQRTLGTIRATAEAARGSASQSIAVMHDAMHHLASAENLTRELSELMQTASETSSAVAHSAVEQLERMNTVEHAMHDLREEEELDAERAEILRSTLLELNDAATKLGVFIGVPQARGADA